MMELFELTLTFFVGAFASVILVNIPGFYKNLSKSEDKKEKVKFDIKKLIGLAVIGGIASVLISLNVGLEVLEPYFEVAGLSTTVLFLLKAILNKMKQEISYI